MSTTTLAPTLLRTPTLVREVTLVVAGVLLVSLAAQVAIPLPFTPVPLTGQTFAALLVGGAYGAGRAGVTMLAYLAVGSVGLPVFAGGAHGAGVLGSATGGYLVGMALASVLVGWAAERGWDRRLLSSSLAMLAGSALIYLVGATWLAFAVNVGPAQAVHLGVTPFVAGDVLKLVIAGALLPTAWRLVGDGRSRA